MSKSRCAHECTTLANVRERVLGPRVRDRSRDVASRSLALADETRRRHRARRRVGALAPLDIVQAQAEEAIAARSSRQADATRRTAGAALKRRSSMGGRPVWTSAINPVDRPPLRQETIGRRRAVRTSARKPDRSPAAQKQPCGHDVALRNLSDSAACGARSDAAMRAAGVGGPQSSGRASAASYPDDPERLLDCAPHPDQPDRATWNFALPAQLSHCTSPADANLARARIQRQQTVAQSRQMSCRSPPRSPTPPVQVDSNRERLQAAGRPRAAERRLNAEQSRFDVGLPRILRRPGQRDLPRRSECGARVLSTIGARKVEFARVQEVPTAGSAAVSAINAATNRATRRAPRAAVAEDRRRQLDNTHTRKSSGIFIDQKNRHIAVIVAAAARGGRVLLGMFKPRQRGAGGDAQQAAAPGGAQRTPGRRRGARWARPAHRGARPVVHAGVNASSPLSATVGARRSRSTRTGGRLEELTVKLGDPGHPAASASRGSRTRRFASRSAAEAPRGGRGDHPPARSGPRSREDQRRAPRNLFQRQLRRSRRWNGRGAKVPARRRRSTWRRAQNKPVAARLDERVINLQNTLIVSPVNGSSAPLGRPGAFVPPTRQSSTWSTSRACAWSRTIIEKELKQIGVATWRASRVDAFPR